jgi:hypothetical protein
LFPHIYGPINLDAIIEVIDFPCDDQGTLTAPDGSVYCGEWSDGVPHGNGSMTYPGGRVDPGVWHLGKKV